ncbi:PAS domain-containing protein [Pontibacter oryzae]|uniref:histidine kinase n=1 Tax=Pontibacter oryzae TaxID=2304593 RepID=A0A399S5N5_9BACT|nr:PAS domain-containing protein [Pontibacter oryzae]RIJ37372.1 PAS domain S-box protein [Pontibacter oryzae]
MEKAPSYTSAADFVALFESLPGLYLLLSPDLRIQAATKSYLRAINADEHEIIGKYFMDAFSSTSFPANSSALGEIEIALVKSVTEKDTTTLEQLRLDVLAGQEAYWEATNTPMFDAEGKLTYILQEVRDITKKVFAEREFASTQDNLLIMSKVAGVVVWECDVPANKLVWSDSYKEIFGYTDSDLITTLDVWDEQVHPDDFPQLRNSLNNALLNGQKSWTGEYRYRRADGTYADVFDHGYIFYDPQQKPLRMLGSIVDITNQKKHAHEVKESNERFERVAMATNDVIWDWDLVNQTVWWNEGFKTLFGYDDAVLLQEPGPESWTNRIHPDDIGTVSDTIHHTIDHGSVWQAEYRFRCQNGAYKLVLDKGYVIRNEKGESVRMVGAMVDITEQRETALKLQASMARTQDVLESLPLMTWTATPEGNVDYYSSRWYDYTAASFDELKNWGWEHFIHPDDWEITKKVWLKSLKEASPFHLENRWLSKSGEYRWFLARALPIYDSAGNITMWVGSHTDIEEQKQMMLKLEDSNSKFMMLAESIPHIVWSGNPDGHVDYFNQQWYDYTKMTQEETLGFGWGPSLHPDDQQPTVNDWLHSMRTGEKYERELRLRDINTEDYRWFLARALPHRNAEGEIVKWFGTATYIHEQKLLREKVEESEKQFRFLAESIPQLVWTTRPDGYTDYFNKRWYEYTGMKLENSLGDAWNTVLHPDDQKRAIERFQYSLRTGEYYEIEYRIKNGYNDTYRWFLGQGMPMRDEQGNIIKWFGTCTDIEDHKRAEEELVEKNIELERINQDLDSFVYTASHDLKLPIINMSGIFDELMNDATFNDPDAPKLIEMFNKSLKQLHNTIYDLSEVVRIQRTKDHKLDDIDLNETIKDVLTSVQDQIDSMGAKVSVDFSAVDKVPFTRSSLKSILYNLVSNALKYRSPDRMPEISVTSALKADYIELKVQDNGLGIDMNKHESKLFQMFKRFHSHVKGSGLGLYIVNRLLSNHGGYINIESSVNEGTTFYLYFKLKK